MEKKDFLEHIGGGAAVIYWTRHCGELAIVYFTTAAQSWEVPHNHVHLTKCGEGIVPVYSITSIGYASPFLFHERSTGSVTN